MRVAAPNFGCCVSCVVVSMTPPPSLQGLDHRLVCQPHDAVDCKGARPCARALNPLQTFFAAIGLLYYSVPSLGIRCRASANTAHFADRPHYAASQGMCPLARPTRAAPDAQAPHAALYWAARPTPVPPAWFCVHCESQRPPHQTRVYTIIAHVTGCGPGPRARPAAAVRPGPMASRSCAAARSAPTVRRPRCACASPRAAWCDALRLAAPAYPSMPFPIR